MPQYVMIIGLVCFASAIVAAIAAKLKNRGVDGWAFACFVFPPLLIALLFLPKNKEGPRQPAISRKDLENLKEDFFD